MTESKGRPSKKRAAELSDEIITVALSHFRHFGYEATTLEGIAKALKCSKHTIYRRFADKEALFTEAVTFDRQVVLKKLAAIDKPATNSLEALRQACRSLFELVLDSESTELYRACIGAMQRFPTIGAQFFRSEQALQSVLEVALQRAQSDGYIVDGPAGPMASQLYHAIIGEVMLHSLLGLPHVGTMSEQAGLFERNWTMFLAAYGLKQDLNA